MKRIPQSLGALLLLLLLPQGAQAAVNCTFPVSGGNLINFGTYFSLGGDKDVQGNVQVSCTVTLPDLLASYVLQIGTGLSGNALDRRMYLGSSSLRYNLFSDLARTQVIGNGTGGTSTISRTCVGLCLAVPIYGRLYGGQGGNAGAYSDSVSVRVDF